MISSLFYYYFFKDVTNIDSKYFLNTNLKDYEIFTINVYYYEDYINLFKKKNNLQLFNNLNNNHLENIKTYIKLIKDKNYNKEGIILLYAYLAYYVLNKHKEILPNLEKFYYLNHKINKRKQDIPYLYYDLRKPYYLFLDDISRIIFKYPDITSYLKKGAKKCYNFNKKYLLKESSFKNLYLRFISKFTKKEYLSKVKYIDLSSQYDDMIKEVRLLIEYSNNLLYYNKDKDLIDYFK